MKSTSLRYTSFNWLWALIVFIIPFWGVTYNSDWEGYVYFFNNSDKAPDILFGLLSDIFDRYRCEYYYLYRFHMIAMSLTYLFFISKFINKYLFIVVVLLLFDYVALGNQIRYYVAFPLALSSVYYFYVRKKIVPHILLAVVAILCHSAVVVFFLCFYMMAFVYKSFNRYLTASFIVVNVASLFCVKIAEIYMQGHFGAYFDSTQKSSLTGGIYSILQCCIILFFLHKIIKILKKHGSPLLNDRKVIFLYILSFCTSYLLLPSITTQIINNRYISPLFVVWLVFLLYIRKNEMNYQVRRSVSRYIFLIILIRFLWVYLFPVLLFDENNYIIEALVMLNSYET